MRTKLGVSAAILLLPIVSLSVASPAAATTTSVAPGDGTTFTIDGHTLGLADNLETDNESYTINPSSPEVGNSYPSDSDPKVLQARTAWGTSFAYSKEILQLSYMGYAKSSANVYKGKRIVAVCFWYTRGGKRLIPNTCSVSKFNGGWERGKEVNRSVKDSLNPKAPRTIFHISTVRINPSSHY